MMDFSCYDDMTLEELRDEREELRKAINNEHIWAAGSHTVEDLNIHAQNIADMKTRINYMMPVTLLTMAETTFAFLTDLRKLVATIQFVFTA